MDPKQPDAPAPVTPSRRVPSLFVEEGSQRTAIIAPDEEPMRDPHEAARAREKRRKQQEAERLLRDAEAAASFRRIRNTLLVAVTIVAVVGGVYWIQQRWNGHWPVFFTWLVMSAVMLAGFGWAIWYTEKAD